MIVLEGDLLLFNGSVFALDFHNGNGVFLLSLCVEGGNHCLSFLVLFHSFSV